MMHALLPVSLLLLLCAILQAAPSSVTVVWSGVASFDKSAAVNALDASLRTPGRAGGVSMDGVFLHPRNQQEALLPYRVQLPPVQPGERLILSTWCALSDGVRFDDKQRPPDGAGFAVRIGDTQLFHQVIAESRWRAFAFDLAPWAGQDVAVTLVTDDGGHGNTNYDWALFGQPQIALLRGNALDAQGHASGTAGALLLEYAQAREGATMALSPAGGEPALTVPLTGSGLVYREFGPGELGSADHLQATVTGATVRDLRVCLYQPDLTLETLGSESALAFQGRPVRVEARVRNVGKAALLAGHQASVTLTPGGAQQLPRLEPGAVASLVYTLPPQKQAALEVSASVRWVAEGQENHTDKRARLALQPALAELPAAAPARAEWRELGDGVFLLQNPHVRLAFLPVPFENPPGVRQKSFCGGPVLCFARCGDEWRQVAVMPPVWEFSQVTHNGKQKRELPVNGTVENGRATLTLGRPPVPDAELENRVLQAVIFSLADDGKRVEITCTLQSGVPALVSKLAGPKVLVGDGTTGRAKRMALYPGLEFLQGQEESSSTLDCAPPISNRLMPHPYKVTIPLMAVETSDALVALLWDQTRKWDGEQMTACGAFASPNFVDGQANHMMQLFLPSCPDWVDENRLSAERPYPMKAGATLTLRQHLVIDAGGRVLDALDHWAAEYGGIPAPQTPPRDLKAELALSRHAFLHTVWDEPTHKSRHCVDWAPANSPGFATMLLFDARISGDLEARQRAQQIVAQTLAQDGPSGLLSPACCHILRGELPFHYGHLAEVYRDMRRGALSALAGQGPDGAWRYFPAPGNEALGKLGTATSGTCAVPAWTLLRWARMSGDARALAAGLKGLQYMDKTFGVPHGAEGWECPVHEPDILAAAYAVGAYVEGFRATGDAHWLEGARYWAKTGVPFTYLWDDPKLPGMRYATLPVFGTTFFTHSWFGTPVQWCGLVYAYHLRHLARYDSSFPWARVADGITVSGMYQQFGDERPEIKGCYPDGWYGHFTQRNPPFINPEDIMLGRLAMDGHDPDPDTALLAAGKERLPLTTGARVESARVEGGTARCLLSYFPGEASYGFLTGLAQPEAVSLDGRPLPATHDLEGVSGGFSYDPGQAVLFFKITHGAQPAELVIRGLRSGQPQPVPGVSAWDFSAGAQGWRALNSCTLQVTPDKTLRVTVTGFDPYFACGGAGIVAERHTTLTVRARSKTVGTLGLYWATEALPGFDETKRAAALLPTDGEWHDVAFELGKHPQWRGVVTDLRLDPQPADLPAGATVELATVAAR